ncbi:hypothetical protein PIB30_104532 [Stylosanthes scabra]|uniref:Uncharacterized protein n=1 Tax=Stylosanthes scabra TaxID=79078 RepID=A0ABU6TYT9_9FABA|nr:hypothetical protein [Stylosanthes scabra]
MEVHTTDPLEAMAKQISTMTKKLEKLEVAAAGEIILTSVGVVIKGRGTTTMFKTTIALINLLSSDNSNHFNNPLLQFHHSRNHHLQHHPVLLKLHSRNLLNPLQVLFRTPTAS